MKSGSIVSSLTIGLMLVCVAEAKEPEFVGMSYLDKPISELATKFDPLEEITCGPSTVQACPKCSCFKRTLIQYSDRSQVISATVKAGKIVNFYDSRKTVPQLYFQFYPTLLDTVADARPEKVTPGGDPYQQVQPFHARWKLERGNVTATLICKIFKPGKVLGRLRDCVVAGVNYSRFSDYPKLNFSQKAEYEF